MEWLSVQSVLKAVYHRGCRDVMINTAAGVGFNLGTSHTAVRQATTRSLRLEVMQSNENKGPDAGVAWLFLFFNY